MNPRRLQRMATRLILRTAERKSVILRRRSDLRNAVTGARYSALAVSGAASAGATSIDLDAVNLAGTLEQGAQFTIAGDATVYTVGAPVEAESHVLADVEISPALAANAADNAVVTVVQPYGDYTFQALRAALDESELANLDAPRVRWHLAATGAAVEPRTGDLLVDGADVQAVLEVNRRQPGETFLFFTVDCGAAAA